jgi:hypothetical protein
MLQVAAAGLVTSPVLQDCRGIFLPLYEGHLDNLSFLVRSYGLDDESIGRVVLCGEFDSGFYAARYGVVASLLLLSHVRYVRRSSDAPLSLSILRAALES